LVADQEADILLALRGERAVQAGLGATALSVRGLRNALVESNAEMDVTRHRSFLMNQALFTARRLIYAGTLATIAFTTAVGVMGFKFDMTMENNTVALTQFLGSSQAAQTELTKLYDIAAKTPFEFTDIVDATRRFLAFGFTLKETNRFLNVIGDTVAAFGGGREEIQRMVLVFGQMKAAGRVLGQDLLQLNQLGIPALQILREQLGLTQDQVANIGRLHIPAGIAIEALMRGLTQRFEGASAKQARTLQGRISTLHDYAARLFGTLTLPLYNRLRDYALPQLTSLANEMQLAAKQGGIRGALRVVDVRYGTDLARTFDSLALAGKSFAIIVRDDIIPLLVQLNKIFHPLRIILILLGGGLGFLAHHSTLTKIALSILILEFIRFRTVMLVFGGPGGKGGLIGMMVRAIGIGGAASGSSLLGRFRAWKNMLVLLKLTALSSWARMGANWSILTRGYVKGAKEMTVMTRFQQTAVLGLRNAFIGLSLAELGLIGLTIALVAGLVILYFKWKAFRNIVNETARFLYKYPYILLGIIGPFAVLAIVIVRNFGTIKRAIMGVAHWLSVLVGWAKAAARWLSKIHAPHVGLPHIGIPNPFKGLASGGVVTTGGAFMVGERGPEMAMLPAGSAVTPVNSTNFPVQQFFGGVDARPLKVEVYLDGKQIAKSNARHSGNAKARA
jgi:tape measure domain-containing protein